MEYVVRECSEFPSMGRELITSDLDDAIKQFVSFVHESAAMIPSFGFLSDDKESSCEFFFNKCPEIEFNSFNYYYDLNDIDKALVEAKRISIKISEAFGNKLFYDDNDVQNMINACKKDERLKESVLNRVSGFSDQVAVSSVLESGWVDNFYRYDSDVCEKFSAAYEKASAPEIVERPRIKRSGR